MSNPILTDFLAQYSAEVQELIVLTRSLILRTLPGLLEIVDPPSKIIAFGVDRRYSGLIVAIAPHRAHVNLMFSKGVELPDPDHLLTGTGKHARHVPIKSLADLNQPALVNLLSAAAARAGLP